MLRDSTAFDDRKCYRRRNGVLIAVGKHAFSVARSWQRNVHVVRLRAFFVRGRATQELIVPTSFIVSTCNMCCAALALVRCVALRLIIYTLTRNDTVYTTRANRRFRDAKFVLTNASLFGKSRMNWPTTFSDQFCAPLEDRTRLNTL